MLHVDINKIFWIKRRTNIDLKHKTLKKYIQKQQ